MCVRQMESEGLETSEAQNRVFLVDNCELVTKHRQNIDPRHIGFAKDMEPLKDLVQIVKEVKPHAIIGTSTAGGAFSEQVIREMAYLNDRPIIFPLSNPTSKAECTAEQAYKFTNGTVLFASGSPFENVRLNGRLYKPGQGNNAYIFPGVALSVILFEINHIDNRHFLLAARVVAEYVGENNLNQGRIYPKLKEIRELSVQIAVRIAEECYKAGTANLYPEPKDKEMYIRSQIYNVEYDDLINTYYDWPAEDMRHGFPVPVIRRDSFDD